MKTNHQMAFYNIYWCTQIFKKKLRLFLPEVEGFAYFVSYIQGPAYTLAHSVMFQRQEESVQNDTRRDEQLKQWILHYFIKAILKLQPPLVVNTARYALITVSVRQLIWKTNTSTFTLRHCSINSISTPSQQLNKGRLTFQQV